MSLDGALRAAAVFVLACVALWWSPRQASDLVFFPDAVEYAAGAAHLADGDGFFITVDGRRHPPRYPPWFSCVLAPAYLLGTEDRAGNGILVVLAFGVAGVLAAAATAGKITGPRGGLLAAALVLTDLDYRNFSRQIMTDVPAAALALVGCLLYVRYDEERARPFATFLAAGTVAAVASGFRPLMAFTTLPFLLLAARSGRGAGAKALRLALVIAPTLLVALLTALYNRQTFGSFARSGYHYWSSVPYDFPALTWSARYLLPNLKTLLETPVVPLAALAALLLAAGRRRAQPRGEERRGPRRLLEYAVLGVGPVALLHLFYFFQATRFFLPLSCVLAVLCGALLARALSTVPRRVLWLPLLVLAASITAKRAWSPLPPKRRIAVDIVRSLAPGNAVIVSSIDPAYLELMLGEGTGRTIVALSRDTEYASKLVAPRKVAGLRRQPARPSDWRNPALLAAGAAEAVGYVAGESPERLEGFLREGRRVFLVTVDPAPRDVIAVAALEDRFAVLPQGDGVFELVSRRERRETAGAPQP